MKNKTYPRLYRCTSVVLAGVLTVGSAFFNPGLQTFADTGIPSDLPATPSNGDRDPSKVPENEEVKVSPATPADARMAPAEIDPRFDRTVGSRDVTELKVPTLAYDDTSITLVWEKPEGYDDIADYVVYQDGVKIGTARENFAEHADWADTYMKAFYEYYDSQGIDMVKVDIRSFTATGLKPETSYEFSVAAVDESGTELGEAATLSWETAPTPEVFNILDYGAESVEEPYRTYDDGKNQFIEKNTKAIQAAIDACSEGGKVVIPEGIFMSGALYLKSNMTLELSEGAVLFGSPNADHYDSNYLLYPYSTDTRSWALINAYSSDESGMLENIRITGQGTIDGNGWKYGAKDTINGDGYSPQYQKSQTGDPADENYRLPQWVAGSSSKVKTYGILAADATNKGMANGLSEKLAYSTRPNLIVIRGTENVYVGGITVKNPAFHTIAILDSQNVTSQNVKYTTYDSNNADGIELGNTQNAIVFNNFFDTGDDSINFATGMGKGVQDCEQKPSENIWTFNNFLREGHGGAIAAGSHTGAGICNMLVEDNVLNHSDMPFRFKSAPVNGGGVWDVLIRDCAVGDSSQTFVMSTAYSDANQAVSVEPADKPAEFYNISAYNITVDKVAKNTFTLVADVNYNELYKPQHSHHDLYFQDITFTNAAKGEELRGVHNSQFYHVTLMDTASAEKTNAWAKVSACEGLSFSGGTTSSSKASDAMVAPKWAQDAALTVTEKAGSANGAELSWPAASDDTKVTGYIVETYADGQLVDISLPGTALTRTIEGLCKGVNYTFKVYAADATGNKTEGPSSDFELTGASSDQLKAPSDLKVSFSGEGYTWATAKFANARNADPRVRGYRAYVNDELVKTIYNYEFKDAAAAELSVTVGRMMEVDNAVRLTAFADDGSEISYTEAKVTLSQKYDFKAPEWSDSLTVEESDGNLVLRWQEPYDESGIYGYRVYMDDEPIYRQEGDYFNHVNGDYTTKDTTWTVTGADLETAHTFRVEAADNWWKALNGTGPFHWTFSGPQTHWSKEEILLSLSPEKASVEIGGTVQLHATVTPEGTPLTWKSSDENIAAVDSFGLVTGLAEGTAAITVSAGDESRSSVITVTEKAKPDPSPMPDPDPTPNPNPVPGDDSDGSDGDDDGSVPPSSGYTTTDSKKGVVNTLSGIITGRGEGYSQWIPEPGTQDRWKLQYADGTFAAGTVKTDSRGNSYEQPAWELINGAWYAFGTDGFAQSGLIFDHDLGGWFYIDINSGMKTGWQLIDGSWYYFNPVSDGTRGKLYVSGQTPDGFRVDEKGRWIP